MLMDSLHLTIALGPLAIYLLVVGLMNVSTRPVMTTGTRDVAALAIGLSGLFVVGPMELFFPEAALEVFGAGVWLMMIALYALIVTLILLVMRPRLVIYNVPVERLKPLLADVAESIDPAARMAGDALFLPNLGVQLQVDTSSSMKTVQLISVGPRQSHPGWRRLERMLRTRLSAETVSPNPWAAAYLAFAMLIIVGTTYSLVQNRQHVARAWHEMLRIEDIPEEKQ